MTERNRAVGPDEQAEAEQSGPTGPVIRDKRRLDPQTGQVRRPAEEVVGGDDSFGGAVGDALPGEHGGHAEHTVTAAHEGEPATYARQGDGAGAATPADGDPHPDTAVAAARLEDLRRLQAEYVNYKRRVDRDRDREREAAIGTVVEALLPVMDDIHHAREHGDLVEGPFAAIADKIEATLGRFGVEQFGAVGEVFDPTLHEALMHLPQAELPEGATETTVVQIMQPGFKVGERLVRPARVAVADPE